MSLSVVCNASPLIALSAIDRLGLLRDLWSQVAIPKAVFREVVTEGRGRPGTATVAAAVGDWVRVTEARDRQEVLALGAILDEGEAEVIVLGQEMNADLLLIDNREPRLFARSLNMKVMGTVGVLRLAWLKGLVREPVAELERLRRSGFWLSDALVDELREEIRKGR